MKDSQVTPYAIIYAIKTMTKLEPLENYWSEFGHERNVGFYVDFNNAYEIVHNNGGDLWETIYEYAMIEEVGEGLYGSAGMRTWWFKYNHETGLYDEIPMPEFCKNKFGFIIG